jgi:hypothetical protein
MPDFKPERCYFLSRILQTLVTSRKRSGGLEKVC